MFNVECEEKKCICVEEYEYNDITNNVTIHVLILKIIKIVLQKIKLYTMQECNDSEKVCFYMEKFDYNTTAKKCIKKVSYDECDGEYIICEGEKQGMLI